MDWQIPYKLDRPLKPADIAMKSTECVIRASTAGDADDSLTKFSANDFDCEDFGNVAFDLDTVLVDARSDDSMMYPFGIQLGRLRGALVEECL